MANVLELQLQHQSFQCIFRVDSLLAWLNCTPCSLRNSQESSPAPQFEIIKKKKKLCAIIPHEILSKTFVFNMSNVHPYLSLPSSRQHFSAPLQVWELCDYVTMECEQAVHHHHTWLPNLSLALLWGPKSWLHIPDDESTRRWSHHHPGSLRTTWKTVALKSLSGPFYFVWVKSKLLLCLGTKIGVCLLLKHN